VIDEKLNIELCQVYQNPDNPSTGMLNEYTISISTLLADSFLFVVFRQGLA
jgi:hypothetical protein